MFQDAVKQQTKASSSKVHNKLSQTMSTLKMIMKTGKKTTAPGNIDHPTQQAKPKKSILSAISNFNKPQPHAADAYLEEIYREEHEGWEPSFFQKVKFRYVLFRMKGFKIVPPFNYENPFVHGKTYVMLLLLGLLTKAVTVIFEFTASLVYSCFNSVQIG